MSRLEETLKNKKSFIAFVTANDPDMETTVENVVSLAKNGADVVEIGIPFSDPVADGPVIQKADLRALRNPDLPIKDIFNAIKEIRKQTNVPLVFLTYLNVVLQYGYDKFCQDCQKFEVDGMIVPDLPYEEQEELLPFTQKYNVDLISLITPNSLERVPMIAKRAQGFIYLVSSLGVTGEREEFSDKLNKLVMEIKKYTDVPVEIGFGIHSASQAKEMSKISDGVIIGSAFVKLVEKYQKDAPNKVGEFANEIKKSISKS